MPNISHVFQYRIYGLLASLCILFSLSLAQAKSQTSLANYPEWSATLLEATLSNQPTEGLQVKLAQLNEDSLAMALDNDAKRKSFWINIYNSYIILLLRENPALFQDRGTFFSEPRVRIAGNLLSFDDIEHGFIRRSKIKLGLGIIPDLFPGDLEKKFRVDEPDPRIHFALNCGAKACPPVRIYVPEKINSQLEHAARTYLTQTTQYNPQEEWVKVTPLMSWFRGDFDGKEGSKEMLKRFKIIPPSSDPKVDYLDYDWTLYIDNYIL